MSREKIGALIFLTFSIAYSVLAMDIATPNKNEALSPRAFPIVLGVLGAGISLLLLIAPSNNNTSYIDWRAIHWPTITFLAIWMVTYGFLLTRLGFILSTLLFLNGGFVILREARPKTMFYMSVPLVLSFWFIMTKFLHIFLPPGSWFT